MTGPDFTSPLRPAGNLWPLNEAGAGKPSPVARLALKKALSAIEAGRLTVETPSGERIERIGARPGPDAQIRLNNWRAIWRLALQGDLGFAAAYRDGDWSSPDLTALLELAALSGAGFKSAVAGAPPFRLFDAVVRRLRRNTRRGSRRNVKAHYDLGNEFYRLWLDARMIYSSAIFRSPTDSLESAQAVKLQAILDQLRLAGAGRVLEIGCGWGALAARIAAQSAARVTAVTLSPAQLRQARASVANDAFVDRIDWRVQDYRDVEGQFDRIVSVEMIEAVGREYLPDYFCALRRLLKPGGRCILQAITIADDRFAAYCRRPDFIGRYIFPGGFLPSKRLLGELADRAGLALAPVESFGDSYGLTLREWRRRFLNAWPQIEDLGFGASFRRLWEYYLCYCEAGFRAGAIDVGLYSLTHAERGAASA